MQSDNINIHILSNIIIESLRHVLRFDTARKNVIGNENIIKNSVRLDLR